ncbi:visual pigment-like receptor peropsin [Labeo rohita]|uniref:Visual pigment-like receptor peropsin n=3 Tax=Labeo rohita TaxID=84645 RepID=A0A498LET0_LABRO|nr:visual pigment-like receptor peropsin [Labeo rohita]RXN15524.1 visual pigment-like receptor peropsin [Labeo rohita]
MASIGLLTVVAIDRYLTICRPDIDVNVSLTGIYMIMCDKEMASGVLNASAETVYGEKSAFTQTEHNIVAAYLITAGVVSLSSNIVVLLMFVKFRDLRTATNAIIINLAFTDIGVAGIGYPMSAASDLHGSWKFGYTGCQIYAALNIFFGMASIGLLTVVAIDRYLTICRPDIGQKLTTVSYTLLIMAAWLNAVFWSSMPIVGWAGYAPDPTGATCTINWRNNDTSFVSYTMTVITVNFIIPLAVMFYCYYNVSVTVKRYKASNCLDSINIDWSDQMDVTKMSIIMIVMFLTAWSPYSIVCLWASFGDPKTIPAPMAIIAPLFAKSSTFYNPCIYVIANKKFRRAITGMLRCQTRQRITISNQYPMTASSAQLNP